MRSSILPYGMPFERPGSGTERGRENNNNGIRIMNQHQLTEDTEPRSVDRQQACSPLVWHAGPASGGGGTAGGCKWWDGDRLLVVVSTNSGPDVQVVSIHADGHFCEMRVDEETWGWEMDDVSWWAKLEDKHLPAANAPALAQSGGAAFPRSEWHIDHRRRLCQPAWNEKEITAIEKLAEMKDMDTAAVIRQALRQYHAVAHGACSITWPNAKVSQEAGEKDL